MENYNGISHFIGNLMCKRLYARYIEIMIHSALKIKKIISLKYYNKHLAWA